MLCFHTKTPNFQVDEARKFCIFFSPHWCCMCNVGQVEIDFCIFVTPAEWKASRDVFVVERKESSREFSISK